MSLNNIEKFTQKIADGNVCAGCVITLTDPTVSELAAEVGYDFTWIDMEHAALNIETVLHHVMALRGTNTAPVVRVPWNDPVIIKQVLELEPAGIIIPMVNSPQDAARAVTACRYPPLGIRGIGPRRGTRYGSLSFEDYVANSEKNVLTIIQIEHIDAVQSIEEILDVPGIDSICIGPSDLSASMGKIAQSSAPEVITAIDRVAQKTKEHGLPLGTAAGDVQRWLDRGVDWIALGSDCSNMAAHGRNIVSQVKQLQQDMSHD